MKRSLHERTKEYFIRLGRKSKLLKIPAIIGLAVSMLLHRFFTYCKGGTKRFMSTAFILLCFMVGNSFAYPVFQDKGGFVSGNEAVVAAVDESNISLAEEQQVRYDDLEVLDDDDVLDGYDDDEFHGAENIDKYLLDEILKENEEQFNSDSNADGMEENDLKSKKDEGMNLTDLFTSEDWKLVLINKQYPVPAEYAFTLGGIKTIKGEMQCDERIIEELLLMMKAANEEGVNLAICSPYRDFNRQEVLFNRKIQIYMDKGMSYMDAYALSSQAVTVPGASEHQIGLAIDIVSDTYMSLDEGFADTSAGIWLEEHCAEYGFILRYPQGKEYITSIEFEPWHFRYVGKEAATVIMEEEICLEEFWDKYL